MHPLHRIHSPIFPVLFHHLSRRNPFPRNWQLWSQSRFITIDIRRARVLFQIHYTRVYNTKSLDKRGRTRIRVHVSLRKGERRRKRDTKEKDKSEASLLSLIFNDWLAGLAIWPITIEFLEFRGITNQNYMVGAATKVSARIGNKNLRFEAERKKKGVDRHETKPGKYLSRYKSTALRYVITGG